MAGPGRRVRHPHRRLGHSYGGGAIWNALAGGAVRGRREVRDVDGSLLRSSFRKNLSKSGAVTGFLSEIPTGVLAPALETFRAWALTSSNLPALRLLSDERSALPHLPRVTTPVFMMQGRRDFAFGIDQATRAYSTLAGPKALWIGNHGHAPSRFPAVDTPEMMAAGKAWFDRYLQGLRWTPGHRCAWRARGCPTLSASAGCLRRRR